MRRIIAILATGLALAQAAPASAQPAQQPVQPAPPGAPRAPAERQTLLDLAYVLGRSHALRQACAGAGDQYWRARMQRLIATEAPDAAFDRQLEQAFNNGYAAAQAAFPRCGPAVRREQARAAGRGRSLATTLTGPVAEDDPSR